MDPQGHSSLGLGVKSEDISHSLYDVLDESQENPLGIRDVRIPVSNYLHFVPSEVVLSAIEQKLAGMPERENKLFQKLQGLDPEYDFVLIDCPPNLGLLTFNALRAAKELIIPIECSSYSLHGLTKILETAKLLEEALGHKLMVHALLNDFDSRTRFSKKIREKLEQLFASQLFRTVIHHSVRLREAAACGQPISEFDRNSIGFKDFLNLSAEVIEQEAIAQREVRMETFTIPDFSLFDIPPTVSSDQHDEHEGKRSILFTIKAPGARFVQIAGDFNNWVPDELLPSIKEGGIWRKLYHLEPGSYKYKFIVDGEWTTDPPNSYTEPNPFGGSDSVVRVEPQEVFNGKS